MTDTCFRTLMRIFPNAKVVLTVRDPEKWYTSVKTTIWNARNFVHGTIGLFLKLVGQHRRMSIVISTSQQGPPVTKGGNYFHRTHRVMYHLILNAKFFWSTFLFIFRPF